MQITHEEARTLIQFDIDRALGSQEKSRLAAHLQDCAACRAYAEEIKEIESILVPAMKNHWSLQPLPLSIGALLPRSRSKTLPGTILTTRTAALVIVLMTFVFSAWQFRLSSRQEFHPLAVSVPPIPTPSTQSTSTTTAQTCEGTIYIVQGNDTLEGIASRFTVSKQQIMAANNLPTEALYPGMELVILTCSFTPTGTENPSTLTTTFTHTPATHSTTSTPDG